MSANPVFITPGRYREYQMLRSGNGAVLLVYTFFHFQNLDSFLAGQLRERYMGVILINLIKVYYSAE